jgi:hypothetical protein
MKEAQRARMKNPASNALREYRLRCEWSEEEEEEEEKGRQRGREEELNNKLLRAENHKLTQLEA